MTEVLFILTTIFVAYVVYEIVGGQQTVNKPAIKPTAPKVVPEVQAIVGTTPKPKPKLVDKEPPAEKVIVKASDKPVTQSGGKSTGTVRDPKTGEITKIANNYRFVKRWIKDALVAEGLLEKVYKNNELDETAEAAIKQALIKFEALEKYRA